MTNIDLTVFKNTKKGTFLQMMEEYENAIGEYENRNWRTNGGEIVSPWSQYSMDEEIGDDLYLYPDFSYNPII